MTGGNLIRNANHDIQVCFKINVDYSVVDFNFNAKPLKEIHLKSLN